MLYAPGIGDDGRGLAALLSIVHAFNETDIQTVGDVLFGGTVGEEGLGDLRGVKAIFKEHTDIDGFISIESGKGITYFATGSHRYEFTYHGPGGHSFGAFGLPSTTHALGRVIAKIADLETPNEPKTTFTVGVVSGGTSIRSVVAGRVGELIPRMSRLIRPTLSRAAADLPHDPRACRRRGREQPAFASAVDGRLWYCRHRHLPIRKLAPGE